MEERLQKILSAYGVGSRRAMETAITEGRVTVNGVVAQLGEKADPETDTIAFDGVALQIKPKLVYCMLNKPRGIITSLQDEKGRSTVGDLMQGIGERVWPIGRLDYDSDGLLLMTNDGDLTNVLTHPRHNIDKTYHVLVRGQAEKAIPALMEIRDLDGDRISPAKVTMIGQRKGNSLLEFVIHEGKNRQIRRMCEKCGLEILSLTRVKIGDIKLDSALKPGDYRPLNEQEIAYLKRITIGKP